MVSHVTILKLYLYVSVFFPASPEDGNYQKEVLKTMIDYDKIFRGISGNLFSKMILENYLKVIDFEPKFPLKPVSSYESYVKIYLIFKKQF